MRPRSLIVWLVLPPALCVLLTAWFAAHVVESERRDAERLGYAATDAVIMSDALAWIAAEITDLIALDAFDGHHPGLDDYRASADALAGSDLDYLVESLRYSDKEGASALRRFEGRVDLPPFVEHVLRPLSPETLARLADGETGFIDPKPFGEAGDWLWDEDSSLEHRAAEATRQLQRFTARSAPWTSPWFVGLVVATAALFAAGAAMVLSRVNAARRVLAGRVNASEAEAAALKDRTERYRHLIELGRRMSAQTDVHSLSHALVAETKHLLGGDVVSLVRREGTEVRPVVVAGELPVTTVPSGHGVVGRTVDAGTRLSTVVGSDPFVPGVQGPLALLTAPLVIDGQVIGAMVVGSRSTSGFDDNDAMALELLAFLAAGAVTAAQRLDSTVALTLSDPLTGLANRRKLDLDLAKCAVTESSVAFLMVDIDHFKAFNDRHGHQVGDSLLRTVAGAITSAVREGDVVYRYGGEEFSVLLRGADPATAALVAERIRNAVSEATAHVRGAAVTVSIGAATQAGPIVVSTLLAQADAALYAAKGTGRDRVVMHGASFA